MRTTTTTVRVSERSHTVLRRLAEQKGITMAEALDEVAACWERQQFFQHFNHVYSALQADPDAWAGEMEERRLWETTLQDGLTDDDDAESQPG